METLQDLIWDYSNQRISAEDFAMQLEAFKSHSGLLALQQRLKTLTYPSNINIQFEVTAHQLEELKVQSNTIRIINTDGGDYAKGNIDKRQGIFITHPVHPLSAADIKQRDNNIIIRYLEYFLERFNRPLPLLMTAGSSRPLLTDCYIPLETRPEYTLASDAQAQQRVVVLGEAGSGKSAFLKYIGLELARAAQKALQEQGELRAIPLYAALPDVVIWAARQEGKRRLDDASLLWDYLISQLRDHGQARVEIALQESFATKLFFLFDGLDELSSKERPLLIRAVRQLTERPCGTLLSCRTAAYDRDLRYGLCEWDMPRTIQPLNADASQALLYRNPLSKNQAATLYRQLRDNAALQSFLGSPLLLTMIIQFYSYYKNTDITQRVELYERLLQLILFEWPAHRTESHLVSVLRNQNVALQHLDEQHIRHALEELIYQGYTASTKAARPRLTPVQRAEEQHGLPIDLIRARMGQLFEGFGLSVERAASCAEMLMNNWLQNSAFVYTDDQQYIQLPHSSFRPYMAACYLTAPAQIARFDHTLYTHWKSDPQRWEEVVLFAMQQLSSAKDTYTMVKWLQRLLQPARGTRQQLMMCQQQAALLAAHCIQEIGGFSALHLNLSPEADDQHSFTQKLQSRLVECVEGTELSATQRVQAGQMLNVFGDPRKSIAQIPPQLQPVAAGIHCFRKHEGQPGECLIQAFELGRYCVTNAQYQQFIEADGYNAEAAWWQGNGQRWLQQLSVHRPASWDDERFGSTQVNLPVVGVSWYEAVAFCRWLTLHDTEGRIYMLPSEIEWEYAAAHLPWGMAQPTYEQVNGGAFHEGTSAAGCFQAGASPEAVHDLCGNVWEWTRSVFYEVLDCRYGYIADMLTELRASEMLVLRGGTWNEALQDICSTRRLPLTPDRRERTIGFRVACYHPEALTALR